MVEISSDWIDEKISQKLEVFYLSRFLIPICDSCEDLPLSPLEKMSMSDFYLSLAELRTLFEIGYELFQLPGYKNGYQFFDSYLRELDEEKMKSDDKD